MQTRANSIKLVTTTLFIQQLNAVVVGLNEVSV